MRRTFRSTATSHILFSRQHLARICFAILISTLALGGGCTSVPTVSKVGLIAPFEGLYRQTGYSALDALRLAIADCAPADVNIVPLALDDSAQPHEAARSAQELLADPDVVAIIGPYSLPTLDAVTPHLAQEGLMWVSPIAVNSDGQFAVIAHDADWLSDLVLEIAQLAVNEGASSVAVGGIPDPWIAAIESSIADLTMDIPIVILAEGFNDIDLQTADALVWMGQPHDAAKIPNQPDSERPSSALWMGPQGGESVFYALNNSSGARYWVSWVSATYNAGVPPAPGALTSDLTYAATCHALNEVYGRAEVNVPSLRLQVFRIETDGTSTLIGGP